MSEVTVWSVLGVSVTAYALLMLAGIILAACALILTARKRGLRPGGAAVYALLCGVLGLFLGRAVYCVIRAEWLFYDGLGEYIGLSPFFDPAQGRVNVIGVLLGILLAAPLAGKLTKQPAARYLDAAALPGIFLFAFARFIEPLSGQGYGDLLFEPALCFFPLALSDEFGDYSLSVCFIEGLLAVIEGIVLWFLRKKTCRDGTFALVALALLCAVQMTPETLRVDDVLFLFIFARVTQIGYAVLLAGTLIAPLIRGLRRGMPAKEAALEIALLLLGVGVCVAAEFALDKTNLSHALIYAVLIAALAAMAWLVVSRIQKEDI